MQVLTVGRIQEPINDEMFEHHTPHRDLQTTHRSDEVCETYDKERVGTRRLEQDVQQDNNCTRSPGQVCRRQFATLHYRNACMMLVTSMLSAITLKATDPLFLC